MQSNTGSLPFDASQRKAVPLASGLFDYFPDALVAVATLSRIANDQHHAGQPLHWDRNKSSDHDDALLRHFVDRGGVDGDGARHRTKVAWRALAALQEELERFYALPAPRGTKPRVEFIPDAALDPTSPDGFVEQLLPPGTPAGEM